MLWQVAAASALGCLFYLKRIASWVRSFPGLRSERGSGFVFATAFALVTSPLAMALFGAHPLPRFNDLFLIGIVLTAYFFTWEPALYLTTVSLAVAAWILPPSGSFVVQEFSDRYRLVSFGALSIFLICLITRMKIRWAPKKSDDVSEFGMSRATAVAD